jgi:hypothetical protein
VSRGRPPDTAPSGVDCDRILGIDWSGAEKPANQRIHVAELDPTARSITTVVRAADRTAVERFLGGGELEPAARSLSHPAVGRLGTHEAVLVGLDFAFSFPAGFALPGRGRNWSWEDLARWTAGLEDAKLEVQIRREPGLRRQFFLGKGDAAEPLLRTTERELVDRGRARATSVLHLVGAQQVGRGAIRGIPMLARLRACRGAAIWPFDPPAAERLGLTIVEVFPRLWLMPGMRKQRRSDRRAQLGHWEREGIGFEDTARAACVASPDAIDAAAAAIGLAGLERVRPLEELPDVAEREGWIAGA